MAGDGAFWGVRFAATSGAIAGIHDTRSTMMSVVFDREHLERLTEAVVEAWTRGADRDWSVPAGTLEWNCRMTADHAVDCTFAPAFFLASRKHDAYPDMGAIWSCGPDASPAQLVQSLEVAS